MKTNRKRYFLFSLSIFIVLSFAIDGTENIIEYYQQKKKVKKILLENSKKDKVSILYFYANWCGPCKAYKKSLSSELVQNTLKNAVLIKINIDEDHQSLVNKYAITKVPTFIKVNKSGGILAKITSAQWKEDIPENIAPVMDSLITKRTFHLN